MKLVRILGLVLLFSMMVTIVPAQTQAGSIGISWQAITKDLDGFNLPTTGAGSLTNYKVYCRLTGTTSWAVSATFAPSILSGIVPATPGNYDCKVIGVNSIGEGIDSNIVTKASLVGVPGGTTCQ
jgi:hypothetical protein